MNLLQGRLSTYLTLITVLLLSSAVGVMGADLAGSNSSAWKNRETVSQADAGRSLSGAIASGFFQNESLLQDNDEEGIWTKAISAKKTRVTLTVSAATLLIYLAVVGCISTRATPRNLQYRFIHSR